MKKIFLASWVLLAATVIIGCNNQQEKKETKKETKAPAKDEAVTDGPSVDVITSEDGSIDSIYYDATGKITRISQTGKDLYGEAKLPIVDVFNYTAYGKLGNVVHTVNNSNGAPPTVSQYIFSYTKEGRLYTCTYRTPGPPKKGHKIEYIESKDEIGYTKTGQLLKIINDNMIQEFEYDKKTGMLVSSTILDYDINHEKTRDDVWNYSYDENGRCTQAIAHLTKNVGLKNEDTLSNVYKFEYDTKGRMVSEDDCGQVTINYGYNSKGCQVSYEANVNNRLLVSNIKCGSTKPRNVIYRFRDSDLYTEPYTINLSVVSLPLSWFNADVNEPKEEKKE